MTTKSDIAAWFDAGVQNQLNTHMIIVCDTFDHEDYPIYAITAAQCLNLVNAPRPMQRIMEVYDLRADKAAQLSEVRAMHLPPVQ